MHRNNEMSRKTLQYTLIRYYINFGGAAKMASYEDGCAEALENFAQILFFLLKQLMFGTNLKEFSVQ